MKLFPHIIRIIILSGFFSLFLSPAVAQEFNSDVSTIKDAPPSISRNPFVSGPQGRITGPSGRAGRSRHISISKKAGKMTRSGKIDNIKVTGILLEQNDAMALLGNKVVKIGDMIDEFIVVDITHTSVTLTNGKRVLKLFIRQ